MLHELPYVSFIIFHLPMLVYFIINSLSSHYIKFLSAKSDQDTARICLMTVSMNSCFCNTKQSINPNVSY